MNVEWKWQQENAKLQLEIQELRKIVESLGANYEEPIVPNKRKNRWTDEERALAEQNDLSANGMNLVSIRINKLGWSKEQALNTPKMSEAQRERRVTEGTRAYHERRKKDGYWETI